MRSRTYAFGDLVVKVSSDLPDLFDFIDRYANLRPAEGRARIEYALEPGEPEQPAVPPLETVNFEMNGLRKHHFALRGEAEAWYIYEGVGSVRHDFESGTIRARCSLLRPDFLTLYVLFAQALMRAMARWDVYFVHGACLRYKNRGVLVAGVSGRGKSTAAWALMAGGAQVVTDESVLLDARTGRATALLDVVKLRETAVSRFFPALSGGGAIASAFYEADGDLYMRLRDLGVGAECVGRIDDLFILEQTGLKETEIAPAEPTRVFPELFPTAINPRNPYRLAQRVEAFCAMIQGARCHAVRFGTDMDAFARRINEALEG